MQAFSNDQCQAIAEIIREEMSDLRVQRRSLSAQETGQAIALATLANRLIKLFMQSSPEFDLKRFKDILTYDDRLL